MNLENEFTVPVPVDEAWRVLLDVERVAPCMPGATLTSVDGDDFTGTVKVKVGPITVTYKGEARFVSKDDATHTAVIEGKGKESRGSGTAGATVTATLVGAGATTKARVTTDLNVTGRPAQFGRGVMAEVAAKLIDQFARCLEDEINSAPPVAAASVEPTLEPTVEPTATAPTAATAPTPTPSPAPSPAKKTAAAAATTTKKTAAAKKATTAGKTTAAPAAGAAGDSEGARATTPIAPRREAEPIDLLDVAGGSVVKRLAPVVAAVLLLLLILRRRRRS
jgi:carbon monoxide dehydrogenase subunit G